MKTVAITLMAVLFAATTVDAGFNLRRPAPQKSLSMQAPKVWETKEQNDLDYTLQGARGFYQGFQKGLYKTSKVDDSCLSKDAEEKIVELFGMIMKQKLDMNHMLSLVSDVMIITQSIQSCNMHTISDIGNFCFRDGVNTCTPDKIADNVQKNLFVIMAKFTDISNLAMGGIPKDSEQAFQFGITLGTNVGSLIRIVLGFHN